MLGLENDVAHCPHMLGQGILIQDIFQKISLLPGLFLSLIRWICLPEVCDEHIIHNASGMILGLLVLSKTLAIGHSIVKAQFSLLLSSLKWWRPENLVPTCYDWPGT